MSVKNYRVWGEVNKKTFFESLNFNKVVAATKEEHALEKVYADIGSRHRAKRHEIQIHGVEEQKPEE
jgi:large subunit ribosomal protein LX